jgi:hypothetical protein
VIPRTSFEGVGVDDARAFAARWLPAWTGNDPERLLAFYDEQAWYADPAVPHGLTGHAALRAYFTKLLAANPSWVWTQVAATPMAGGFVNHWHARIPAVDRTVELEGVCLVQLAGDRITRNEVFFDRSPLRPAP